jgi:plastocyanin
MTTRLALLVVVTAAILASAVAYAATSQSIAVIIDGEPQSYAQSPQLVEGHVMVPMRAIFQSLGATVRWDSHTRQVLAQKGDTEVGLIVGSPIATVGARRVILDVPPQMSHDTVFVPLRFVGEALGAQVAWQPASRRVMIATAPAAPTQPAAEEMPAAPEAPAAAAVPTSPSGEAAHAPAAPAMDATAPAPEAGTEPAAIQRVRVRLTDYDIKCTPSEVASGTLKFYVSNDGPSPHALAIDGMKERTATLKSGQRATLQVDLKPATYTLYCPVDAHRALGMKTRFVVK